MAGTVLAGDPDDKPGSQSGGGKAAHHEEEKGVLPTNMLPMENLGAEIQAPPPQVKPPFPVKVTNMTDGRGDSMWPSWGPGGGAFVFQHIPDGEDNWQIFKMAVASKAMTRLTNNPEYCDSKPIYTPDGRYIIFSRNRDPDDDFDNDHAEIWMMNANGSGQHEITPTGDTICRGSRFNISRDGTKLAYRYDDQYLYIMDMGTGVETEIFGSIWPPEPPKFSPDGSKILFKDGSYYLNVINVDGSGHILLYDDTYTKGYDWSPSGSKIVFTRNDSTPYGLCTINPDGTGFDQIIASDDYCAGLPDWSPNGKWITFVYGPQGSSGDDSDIRIYSANPGAVYSLTPLFNRCDDFTNPTFSPDSKKIVYTADYDIFVIEFIAEEEEEEEQGKSAPPSSVAPTLPENIVRQSGRIVTLNVAAKPSQVTAGQPVSIAANIANRGDDTTNYNVSLKINGQVEETKTGTISGGASQFVRFTIYKDTPGTYDVDIDGERASFTVTGADSGPSSRQMIFIGIAAFVVIVIALVVVLALRRKPA